MIQSQWAKLTFSGASNRFPCLSSKSIFWCTGINRIIFVQGYQLRVGKGHLCWAVVRFIQMYSSGTKGIHYMGLEVVLPSFGTIWHTMGNLQGYLPAIKWYAMLIMTFIFNVGYWCWLFINTSILNMTTYMTYYGHFPGLIDINQVLCHFDYDFYNLMLVIDANFLSNT